MGPESATKTASIEDDISRGELDPRGGYVMERQYARRGEVGRSRSNSPPEWAAAFPPSPPRAFRKWEDRVRDRKEGSVHSDAEQSDQSTQEVWSDALEVPDEATSEQESQQDSPQQSAQESHQQAQPPIDQQAEQQRQGDSQQASQQELQQELEREDHRKKSSKNHNKNKMKKGRARSVKKANADSNMAPGKQESLYYQLR
jgi:hypothetical protein